MWAHSVCNFTETSQRQTLTARGCRKCVLKTYINTIKWKKKQQQTNRFGSDGINYFTNLMPLNARIIYYHKVRPPLIRTRPLFRIKVLSAVVFLSRRKHISTVPLEIKLFIYFFILYIFGMSSLYFVRRFIYRQNIILRSSVPTVNSI